MALMKINIKENKGFNRYIVECKYKQEKDIKAGEWVLIDT